MSTHMFLWRNSKNINTFGLKKQFLIKSYVISGDSGHSTFHGEMLYLP